MPSPGALVLPGASFRSGAEDSPPSRFADGARRLSLGQQRLWLAEQRSPGSAACNVVRTFRLRGPLATDALERGVNRSSCVTGSCDTFPVRAGEPVLVVVPMLSYGSCLSWSRPQIRRRRLPKADAAFNLARGPLIRCRLPYRPGRSSADHHDPQRIVTDAESIRNFRPGNSACWTTLSRRSALTAAALPIQVRGFRRTPGCERLKAFCARARRLLEATAP